MGFDVGTQTIIFAQLVASLIMAYTAFNVKDDHVPLRILFACASMLLVVTGIGVAYRGLQEQAGGTPSADQSAVLSMSEVVYVAAVIIFVMTVGYYLVVFIKWVLASMAQYKKPNPAKDEEEASFDEEEVMR